MVPKVQKAATAAFPFNWTAKKNNLTKQGRLDSETLNRLARKKTIEGEKEPLVVCRQCSIKIEMINQCCLKQQRFLNPEIPRLLGFPKNFSLKKKN